MPKSTRDSLFQQALADFLNEFEVKTIDGELKKYSIQTYTLTNQTISKNNVVHDYILSIPKDILIAYRDITSSHPSSEVVWEDSEPIYGEHHVPLLNEFVNSFNTYFNPYRLYVHNSLMSHIRISNNTSNISVACNPICIQIIYHKTHAPFPRPLTQLEEKDNEIRYLSGMIRTKTKKIDTLRTVLNRERVRSKYNYKRMQQRLRHIYTETNQPVDCPVCFEQIVSDKLIIPSCFHYICISCVMKCDTCPLCRDEYDEYIEHVTDIEYN